MKTFIVQLTVEVEDNFNETNLSAIIIDAMENSDFCKSLINGYSININS